MRPIECQTVTLELVAQLDTETLLSRFREYAKDGYPGASMGDGRGSADTPCPVAVVKPDPDWLPTPRDPSSVQWNLPSRDVLGPSDATDREIRADRLQYEQALRFMVTAAQTAVGITNKYLIARTTDSAKEAVLAAPKGSGPCGNVLCDHVCDGTANDRLRKAPKRSGDDPAKATVARCVACDRWWRRHGTERDTRKAVTTKSGDKAVA